MKKYILFYWMIGFILSPANVFAISISREDTIFRETTLLEKLLDVPDETRLPEIDLNTRIAFHSLVSGDAIEKSTFRLDYLRLQVQGNINDRIYYKWLQHLNRSSRPGNLDNMPASIDCLGLGFHITPTLSSFIGKQYADFGGFEYDANPAEVYAYSDLGDYITCFLVGVNFSWWCTPTQELRFQVVDAHSNDAETTYGKLPEEVAPAKTPLGYTLNWNGQFLKNRLYTRCSFSLFHEGTQENVYFLALAAAWIQSHFNLYVDALYSAEDIDKLGILSEITAQGNEPIRARHSGYLSIVSRINYRPLPKLNLFVKGSYETISVRKNHARLEKGKYRTSYGYQGGIEYFPMKDNLRFFALYRGREIHHTHKTISLGTDNNHPQQLSFGLIYKIPIL